VQFDTAITVAKLKGEQDRQREIGAKVEELISNSVLPTVVG
jgi:hypothetical protein